MPRGAVLWSWSALLAVALTLPFATVCLADDVQPQPGWKVDSRSGDVAIFYQDNAQAHARAYQAVGDVDGPPNAVYAVVTDVPAHPRFMPFTTEAAIVQRVSPLEVIAYEVINPPLISRRDAYFRIVLTPGSSPTTVWKSAWTALPDFQPERSGYVRLHIAEGSWLFEPLDGGARTRVTYTSLTNVGGTVPGWMANMSSASVMRKMYGAIRKRVKELGPAPATP
jgi:hypothetical protein